MRASTVLVIEDEPAVLAMLGVALPHYGLPVFLTSRGAEALTVYQQHRKEIGIALIDVQMPEMDGPQTLAALRNVNPNLPAVFMTGNMGRYSTQDLLSLGAACILAKPFSHLDHLVRVLRDVMTGSPAPTGERRKAPRQDGNHLPILLAADEMEESAQGTVLNRSEHGLSLRVAQGVEAGAVLNVRPEMPATAPWMPVEVRHCRQQNHHWVLGCRFLKEPSADVLQLFGYRGNPG